MLQFNALRPDTLDVLKLTMAEPLLNNFTLVGGTALALHFGHRISEDIDLFSWDPFNIDFLVDALSKKIRLETVAKTPIGAHLFIEEVKTDLVYFPIKPIRETLEIDNVRLLGVEDIAAMKLNAIANRGARKDFYDIYFLLEKYPLATLVSFFKERFSTQDIFGLLRSLDYFADAEEQDEIILLRDKKLTWDQVKKRIVEETRKLV